MVKSSSCCEEQVGLKKGPWTPEEDQKLMSYIQLHGHGIWSSLPAKAGLRRCGKSCRLRWINYLRPDTKRGNFSLDEDQTIIQLHALLGNSMLQYNARTRWSVIAHHLPKRTDNEIKNHWNTHLKKRLIRMGINPTTHKPLNDAANLSHMAQWETARLEAEVRQVKEYSKLQLQNQLGSSSSSQPSLTRLVLNKITPRPSPPACLDVLKVWQNSWSSTSADHSTPKMHSMYSMMLATDDLESPASTLSFPDNVPSNSECPNSNLWLMNKSSLSSTTTTTTTVSKDNGIMEGARDGEPCGNKEQSSGDDGIMAAMGALFPSVRQYYEGNEMSPQQNLGVSSVGDDWEAILDLVNGWPRSTAFPVV